jgi:hypothetical protein
MQDHGNPLQNYTIVGRLWIILCMIFGLLIFVAFWSEQLPFLPSGTYPTWFFYGPPLLGGATLYWTGKLIFGAIGIKLRRDPPADE